jgi:aryl-alcohol dehydrogenase-like predicted oxidoreductase
MPQRYDPEAGMNARKYEIIEELDKLAADAGMPLIHLALGFVVSHPAVTSAIIGPRTYDQLEGQLGALEITRLEDNVLDKIDALVRPGTNVDPREGGYSTGVMNPKLRRR